MISPARRFFVENNPLYCPFGKPRVQNVLKDFNNRLHDKHNDKTMTTVLFLESGDLRNALTVKTTSNEQKQGNLHIHLNDCNASIVARNVMMLSIISAPEFNPEDQNDFAFLWDVWYNSKWPETTKNRFKKVLKDLLDGKLPENMVVVKSKHLQVLREIWRSWQATSSKSPADSDLLIEKIDKKRNKFIFQGWKHKNEEVSSISEVLDEITDKIVSSVGSCVYLHACILKRKMFAEARLFLKRGYCRLKKVKAVCVNPTLLHPTTLRWYVHYALSPYAGYLPLSRGEMDVTVENQILIRSCQSVLKSLLLSYRQRMKDVRVFFYTEDALEFCYTERSNKFDVIDCADLADSVGLINLINACRLCLADHPDAQILTKTVVWGHLTPMFYMREMLGCPVSMIPTIYGLRLASHFQAKDPILFMYESDENSDNYISLCWKNAAPLRNVVQYYSPTLTNCFIQLATKCYLLHDDTPLAECCTPLTFHNVTNSAAQRITDGSWINDVARQIFGSELPSLFRLNEKTTTRWASGQPVLKLTADLKFHDVNGLSVSSRELFEAEFGETPALRLALVPRLNFLNDKMFSCIDLMEKAILLNSDVHFIDNVKLEIKKASDDSVESAILSFLLPADHGLEETHFGAVVDLSTRLPVFFIDIVKNLRVKKFQLPYPFERKKALSTSEGSEMLVASSCVETADDYTINVNILSQCKKPMSGVNVSTDQRSPCELAHELTVSISQPPNIKPLKIALPFPFIASSLKVIHHRPDRLVVLVLQKAQGLQPWPCDIHRDGKRMDEASATDGRPVGREGDRCAACEKTSQNLKRCSRCRAINYCSVECQRANWPQHKLVCASSVKNRAD